MDLSLYSDEELRSRWAATRRAMDGATGERRRSLEHTSHLYKEEWDRRTAGDYKLVRDCNRPGCLHRGACGAGAF